jgi:predicted MPP superfamily phosphohydrolase
VLKIIKLCALVFVSAVSVFACTSINTKSYTLETGRLEAGTMVKIVHISDLHSTVYGKNQETLIRKIEKRAPDLIVLSGDIMDDVEPHTGTRLLLAGVRDLAPICYVSGNHEYWSRDIGSIREEPRAFGVVILSDEFVRIEIGGNELVIAGIEDPDKKAFETPDYDQGQAMRNTFGALDKTGAYKILIVHRPENIETYKQFPFDLVLSGHTHGGQIRIPLVMNGLYAPDQGWFPKYAGGLYTHGSLSHIVSRGLSVNKRLLRIFNPPEFVFIRRGSNTQEPANAGELLGRFNYYPAEPKVRSLRRGSSLC